MPSLMTISDIFRVEIDVVQGASVYHAFPITLAWQGPVVSDSTLVPKAGKSPACSPRTCDVHYGSIGLFVCECLGL